MKPVKKGKRPKKSHDIDEFISKEFENLKKNRQVKPLIKASGEVEPPQAAKFKQMIRLKEHEDLPPARHVPKKEPEKAAKRQEEAEEIYEEDFEPAEEETPPPPPPPKPQSKGSRDKTPSNKGRQIPGSKVDYSLEDIKRAMAEENAKAMQREKEEDEGPKKDHKQHIKQAKIVKVEEKTDERNEEEQIQVLEVKPSFVYHLSEFDMMIDKLNKGQIQNSTSQSNSDNIEKEIQTQEIEYQTKETQWPNDIGKMNQENTKPLGSINKFIRRVLPAMEILLEENVVTKGSELKLKSQEQSQIENVKSQLSISFPSFLVSRFSRASFKITDLAFFPQKRNYLAIVYSLDKEGSLILIWDVQQPRKPSRILLSDSSVTSICISNSSEHIVVAGTEIGGLLL